MLFDTHCHLNFRAFDGKVEDVINKAKYSGVTRIVIPGTDIETSKKAVEIAEKFEGIYAAVGIHPHHVFQLLNKSEIQNSKSETNPNNQNSFKNLNLENSKIVSNFEFRVSSFKNELNNIKKLLSHPKVVAIGEVGIDRHIYQKTKYPDYKIEKEFVGLQKIFLKEQIKLAVKRDKSLILHNREAWEDTSGVLGSVWNKNLEGRAVFHCCEPDKIILEFARKHKVFIGIDGDIFYKKEKQEFIKTVPLNMLVLETDSPFLSPDQKSQNEPKNIKVISEFIAQLLHCSIDSLAKQTTENANKLFNLNNK